eukprot:sb/3476235/
MALALVPLTILRGAGISTELWALWFPRYKQSIVIHRDNENSLQKTFPRFTDLLPRVPTCSGISSGAWISTASTVTTTASPAAESAGFGAHLQELVLEVRAVSRIFVVGTVIDRVSTSAH